MTNIKNKVLGIVKAKKTNSPDCKACQTKMYLQTLIIALAVLAGREGIPLLISYL